MLSAVREAVAALSIGSVLAVLFWWPLADGGGLIGGDTYNYFFPLKDFYSAGLAKGEIRLWHPGIGNGVPVLGESQTGVFYPPNLLAYSLLDLNSAYSAIFLSHYVLAFVLAYALGRSVGVGILGSYWVAAVFVYGWFPPRACLEWAIVTGAWMPGIVAAALRWLRTGWWAYLAMVAAAIALQLYAGHFNLAWVTVLLVVCLAILGPAGVSGFAPAAYRRLGLGGAIAVGFLLAAPQLVPTWELKVRSQRSTESFKEELAEGSIPLAYLAQMVLPWDFYADPDGKLARLGARSNKVEAHLYFGLVPLAIAILGLLSGGMLHAGGRWLLIALLFGWLATGIPIAHLADVPGFNFFRYAGRYGLATQLAVAVLVGLGVDRLVRGISIRAGIAVVLLGVTLADLYLVGHQVQYTTIVDPPIIDSRGDSIVFALLRPTDRVLAPDGNTLALSGAACVPPYLGMGPAAYYEIWRRLPNVFTGEGEYTSEIESILRQTGVSHLLTFEPLPEGWPVTLLWRGQDPFLHRRWGRGPSEPLYLYRFDAGWGRAYLIDPVTEEKIDAEIAIDELSPHRVVMTVRSPSAGLLVLTDLDYPGWCVSMDGKPVPPAESNFSRMVDVGPGDHRVEWTYHPISLWQGGTVFGVTLLVSGLFLIWSGRRKRPKMSAGAPANDVVEPAAPIVTSS